VALILYRLFLWLYQLGILVVSPWNPKARLWLAGRKNLFKDLEKTFGSGQWSVVSGQSASNPDSRLTTDDSRLIWFHCASLGEFEQGRPLLEEMRAQYPHCRILLTFFSPSGYEIRKNYSGADYVCYLPVDSPANAAAFLELVKPSLVIWVKYDYWYYYLSAIHKKGIPLLLVSGIFREEQPFFKWYGSLHRQMLSRFTHLFVQTSDSKKLLGTRGFTGNVSVSGDTRFDRVVAIAEQFQPIPVIETFIGNAPVIVAGSTWEEDEEELDHYANTHPEIKFIIAPHEIDEEHLKDIEKLFHHSVRYSAMVNGQWSMVNSQSSIGNSESSIADPASGIRHPVFPNVVIIDNIGLLSKLYKYATIAYIGGGFGYDGVHNVLEAAVYGKPVVFGPEYEKYAEAIGLVDSGGAFSIDNALELEDCLNILLGQAGKYDTAGAAAKEFVYANRGATEKIFQFIQEKRLLTS
jgi:3-deoxy-D-manno-octulosonic-acid transferase